MELHPYKHTKLVSPDYKKYALKYNKMSLTMKMIAKLH